MGPAVVCVCIDCAENLGCTSIQQSLLPARYIRVAYDDVDDDEDDVLHLVA
jgi:hypothetical protein